jgi:hypothetical protein
VGLNHLQKRNLSSKGNDQFRAIRSPFSAPESNLIEFGCGCIYKSVRHGGVRL